MAFDSVASETFYEATTIVIWSGVNYYDFKSPCFSIVSLFQKFLYSLRLTITIDQDIFFDVFGNDVEAVIDECVLGIEHPQLYEGINDIQNLLFQILQALVVESHVTDLGPDMPHRILGSRGKPVALFQEGNNFVANQRQQLLVIISLRRLELFDDFGNGEKDGHCFLVRALELVR